MTALRTLAVIIMLPLLTVAAARAGKDTVADEEMLRLCNGDRLHGALLAVTTEAGLRWRSGAVREVINFATDHVADVTLASRAERSPSAAAQSVVRLTNGDQMAGDISKLNTETLILNTSYAGSVTIKRTMLQSITTGAGSDRIVYAGPTGMEGWIPTDEGRGWRYANGAFVSAGQGGLGRDVKLPDVASIEFDFAWRGEPNLVLWLYIDNPQHISNENTYLLEFDSTGVSLHRGIDSKPNSLGESIEVPALRQKTRAHIALHVNKPAKTIALLLDGALVTQWNDLGEFVGKGTGFAFATEREMLLKISQITISAWDGTSDSADAPKKNGNEDFVLLRNGDKLSGVLKSIAGPELSITTSYATLKMPLARVARIEFAAPKAEQARRRAADIRAWFTNGDHVTLALEKLDEKSLVGASENFGRATFTRDVLRRLQFHIYDEPAKPSDENEPKF